MTESETKNDSVKFPKRTPLENENPTTHSSHHPHQQEQSHQKVNILYDMLYRYLSCCYDLWILEIFKYFRIFATDLFYITHPVILMLFHADQHEWIPDIPLLVLFLGF
jgi:hypothetical protein